MSTSRNKLYHLLDLYAKKYTARNDTSAEVKAILDFKSEDSIVNKEAKVFSNFITGKWIERDALALKGNVKLHVDYLLSKNTIETILIASRNTNRSDPTAALNIYSLAYTSATKKEQYPVVISDDRSRLYKILETYADNLQSMNDTSQEIKALDSFESVESSVATEVELYKRLINGAWTFKDSISLKKYANLHLNYHLSDKIIEIIIKKYYENNKDEILIKALDVYDTVYKSLAQMDPILTNRLPSKIEKTWHDEDLAELKKTSIKFMEEIEKSAKDPELACEVANQCFEKFLSQLAGAPESDEITFIKQSITKVLNSNNIKLLTIIKDLDSLESERKINSMEIKNVENMKKEQFLRKGLVVSLPLDKDKLEMKDQFVLSLATNVSFITHWATVDTELLNIANEKKSKGLDYQYSDTAQYLFDKICPHLAEEKLSPRLERLTILGCGTASPEIKMSATAKPDSVALYLVNTTSSEKLNGKKPFYAMICNKKPYELQLYYYPKEGDRESLSDFIPLDKGQEIFQKSGKPILIKADQFKKLLGDSNLHIIHESIYNHCAQKGLYGTGINQERNVYVKERMTSSGVEAYLAGNKDKKVDKMPIFKNKNVLFQDISDG